MIAALLLALLLSGAGAPPESRTPAVGTKEIKHLIDRIDRYHELLRTKRFADAYAMIGSDWRGNEKEEKEWIDYQKRSQRGMRVESWHVKRMWLSGRRVRVRMVLKGWLRVGRGSREQDVMEEYDFWVLEADDWYRIPFRTPHWDESQAIEVDLAGL